MNQVNNKGLSWNKKTIIFIITFLILSLFPIFNCRDISYSWTERAEGYENVGEQFEKFPLISLIQGGFLYSCTNYYIIIIILIVAVFLTLIIDRIYKKRNKIK